MTYQRPTVRLGAAVIAVAAVMLVLGFALKSYVDPFDDHAFSQSDWAAGDLDVRAAMARDAIRRLPIGMSADNVRGMLGQPTPVNRFAGAADAYGNHLSYPETWSYYLGSWSMYGLDDAFLYVHFDSGRKVTLVEITGG